MFNRIKRAWTVLRSKAVTPDKIYVYPAVSNPNQFVQLLNYQDSILALDAEGKVWIIKQDCTGFPAYQLWLESPRRFY